jgi:hypothetical protein
VNEKTKHCTQCKRELPATPEYFWRDRSKRDGYSSRCRECIYGQNKRKQGPPGRKTCSKCKRIFPANDVHFNRNRARPDGLCVTCKVCANEAARQRYERISADPVAKAEAERIRYAWRAANQKRVKAYYRRYKRSELGRLAERRYRKLRNLRRVYTRMAAQS